MTENSRPRSLATKILAIIGFSATVLLITWLIVSGIRKAPETFVYLASLLEDREVEERSPESTETEDDDDDESAPSTPVATATPNGTEEETGPDAPAPTATAVPAPATYQTTLTHPISNPYGYTDLKITVHGIGEYENDAFIYADAYERNQSQRMLVDIENIGTKTSRTWSFETKLNGDDHYSSGTQAPLRPEEHAFFTIDLDTHTRNDLRIEAEVFTFEDTDKHNNFDSFRIDAD